MIENNWMWAFIPLCIGAITSFAYLGLLWIFTKKFTQQKTSIFWGILGFFVRLGMVGIGLVFIAKWFQILGVLCYLVGFFIVKKIAQRKGLYGYHH